MTDARWVSNLEAGRFEAGYKDSSKIVDLVQQEIARLNALPTALALYHNSKTQIRKEQKIDQMKLDRRNSIHNVEDNAGGASTEQPKLAMARR